MSKLQVIRACTIVLLLVALTSRLDSPPRANALPSIATGQSPVANVSGSGWVEQTVPSGAELKVIHAVDANVAWAAGDASTGRPILRTVDGGENWTRAVIGWPTNAPIAAMFAVSDQICHVGTNFGIVARTTNGGNTWIHTWEGSPLRFVRGIHFFDELNGWAICDPIGQGHFLILETSDGGASWTQSSQQPPSLLGQHGVSDSFAWTDDGQTGIFGTDMFQIMRTTDGGATWDPVPTNVEVSKVAMSEAGIGLAAGDNGQLDRSTDFGATWNAVSNANSVVRGLAFCDEDSEAWATIGTVHAHSDDGGINWTHFPTADYEGNDLDFVNHNHGWSVGSTVGQNASRIFAFNAYSLDLTHVGPPNQIGGASDVVSFAAEIANDGFQADTYDLVVSGVPAGWTYSYTTPAGTFGGPSTLDVAAGATEPITLDLDSQGNPGWATITVTATSQAETAITGSVEFTKLNGLQVLLVDDDGGAGREENYAAALDAMGFNWGRWDRGWGDLTSVDLDNAAEVIVWSAGDAIPTLTEADRTALAAQQDNGGKLFISGQEIGYDLFDALSPNQTAATQAWFLSYLHAFYTTSNTLTYNLTGTPGDPIGDGMALALSTSGPNAQSTPDGIGPLPPAELVFTYDAVPPDGAIKWTDGTAQLVYFAFGYEGIVSDPDREEVLRRILEWFGVTPPSTAIGTPSLAAPVVALAQNWPNPFRPSTSISYALGESGRVSLRVYDSNGRFVRTLVDAHQIAQLHTVEWDGRDEHGLQAPSGIYFYRLVAGALRETRRAVLVR